MSNDNKTLADVQPGGRVRLATVLYDRAHDLLGDAYNAGTHGIGYSQQAMELHDAIIPAQPSPGATALGLPIVVDPTVPPDTFEVRQPSPGETLPPEMRLGSPDYLDYLDTEPSPGGQDARELLAAEFDKSEVTAAAARRLRNHNETAVEAAALRVIAARQPVGEQRAALWIQFAENGNIRFWTKDQDRALAESFLHARPLTAFYASPQPPAQAADLDSLLPAVRMLVVSARTSGGTAGRDTHLCEALDRVEELLPKFDSQAVGK